MRRLPFLAVAVLASGSPSPAVAQGDQRFADLGTCATAGGEVIRDCRIGYRTFGRLNARRDNAVLVPTWHGGRSETMTFILGPDRWVDTTHWFAILVDKPGNGVSTSPSNSRSQPGQRFPRLTLGDMLAAEHRVVTEHLGIGRLHAVVGWSMGGMQAIQYALQFPEAVDRIAPHVTRAAVGDGRSIDVLDRIGARGAAAGVVSTGDDIAASILATMALRDLGVNEVFVKVVSRDHARVMERIGATETVFPERDTGLALASRLSGSASPGRRWTRSARSPCCSGSASSSRPIA